MFNIYELHPCNCLPFCSVQDAKVDLIHELRALAAGGTQKFGRKPSCGYGSKLGTQKLWMVNTKLD